MTAERLHPGFGGLVLWVTVAVLLPSGSVTLEEVLHFDAVSHKTE